MTDFFSRLTLNLMNISKFLRVIPLLFICSITCHAESLSVVTYNTGLLKKYFINLVPCVTTRTRAQVEAVEEELQTYSNFVLNLQEVWTRKGFKAYKKMAKENGYDFVPKEYKDIKKNGQMIISSLPIEFTEFEKFQRDRRVDRGIRSIGIKMEKGIVKVSNIHVSYSDSKYPNPEQLDQLQQISRYFSQRRPEEKTILAGDFNAGPNMNYPDTDYDHTEIIWNQNIISPLEAGGLNLLSQVEDYTWSGQSNPLITEPTFVIRLYNWIINGQWGWEYFSAVIDHVFSNFGESVDQRVTMNEEREISKRCRGEKRTNYSSFMSDHFANSVELNF